MKLIISDEELKSKLRLPLPELIKGPVGNELSLPEIIPSPNLGKPEGTKNIDPLTKELIALDGAFVAFGNMSQTDVALVHGVKQEEVSYLSRAHDRSNIDTRKTDVELATQINQAKFKIIDSATTKLMETLEIFEPSALRQRELPSAALQMTAIIEKLEGRGNLTNAANVQFHIYAPKTRNENDYDVITVNE